MKITLVCSDELHPINDYLDVWIEKNEKLFTIDLVRSAKDTKGGDILFLVSCTDIVTDEHRSKYRSCLVLHASDLPKGRGWSPHIWDIYHGANFITLSLLEAANKVDCGSIWTKVHIPIPVHALWDEINHLLFQAEIELIEFAIENIETIIPKKQSESERVTYHPRRTPIDSQIDPTKSIIEQFNHIRVCDPNRYPAYFQHLGHKYVIKLEKCHEE